METRNGALDVLRAAAIFGVVNCHIYRSFAPEGEYVRVAGLGGRGVDLFYLLSGWLLGYILLAERARTGTVNVPRFWLRRALRTLPAYYAVLAFTVAQQVVGGRPLGLIDAGYWVFAQNYYHPGPPYFGVSWSLCVEEHFYLFVGPALLLLGRSRAVGWVVCGLLLMPTICRLAGWYRTEGLFETHVRYDQCATGVALAWVCIERPREWKRLTAAAPVLVVLGLGFAAGTVFVGNIPWPVAYDACDLMMWTMIFATWVLGANSDQRLARTLDRGPTRFLANRAYALYLLHIDAIAIVRTLGELPLGLRFVLAWAVALVAAELLYRFVERPGMRAREWFRVTRSKAHVPSPPVSHGLQ